MKEFFYDCGAGLELTCEPYKHEGMAACAKCKAAIVYSNEYDDDIVEDFVENMHRCDGCEGCEEGCAVCGQWATYANPTTYKEYNIAKEIFEKNISIADVLENGITFENGFIAATMPAEELDLEALYDIKPHYEQYIGTDGQPHEDFDIVVFYTNSSKIFQGFKWYDDTIDREIVISNMEDKVILTVPYAATEYDYDEPGRIINIYVQNEEDSTWNVVKVIPRN